MSDESKSLEQLRAQLATQEEELKEVNEALLEEADNEELLGLRKDMLELIELTKALIQKKSQNATPAPKIDLDSIYISPLETVAAPAATSSAVSAAAGGSAALASGKSVADRAKAAGIYVGLKCEAIWSGDEQYYTALVEAISPEGVVVKFIEYGDVETISPERIRLDGGRGKKRKEMESGSVMFEVPKWLQILPTDSESVRKAKKKRIKALKLQNKLQEREEASKQKMASWQQFTQNASKKRKMGSFAGLRKESIFKSPEGEGKVGVTGSGKGMTQQQKVDYKPVKTAAAAPPSLSMPQYYQSGPQNGYGY